MALLHFNRDLERLKQRFLALFALVEEALQKSLLAYRQRDAVAAEQVIADDKRVDAAEVEVEEECLKILALHQPIAQDLRYIVSILKINRDLERVGDQAASIARIVIGISDRALPEIPELQALIDQAVGMMQRAFDSIINLDVDAARRVWNEDDIADGHARTALDRIRGQMKERPGGMDALLSLHSMVYILERVADHAKNVAKDVLYTVLGEIVRHRGREFKNNAS